MNEHEKDIAGVLLVVVILAVLFLIVKAVIMFWFWIVVGIGALIGGWVVFEVVAAYLNYRQSAAARYERLRSLIQAFTQECASIQAAELSRGNFGRGSSRRARRRMLRNTVRAFRAAHLVNKRDISLVSYRAVVALDEMHECCLQCFQENAGKRVHRCLIAERREQSADGVDLVFRRRRARRGQTAT